MIILYRQKEVYIEAIYHIGTDVAKIEEYNNLIFSIFTIRQRCRSIAGLQKSQKIDNKYYSI